MMGWPRILGVLFILIGVLAWLAVPLPPNWSSVGLWPFETVASLDSRVLPLIGVPLGLGLALLFGDLWIKADANEDPLRRRERYSWMMVLLALLFAAALLLAAVANEAVNPLAGALVLLCGTAGLLALTLALRGLAEDRPVELKSHWGGLGGSQGGWRLSGTAIAILLSLILISTTVAVGLSDGSDKGEGNNTVANKAENETEAAESNEQSETQSEGSNSSGSNEAASNSSQAGDSNQAAAASNGSR